MIPEEELRKIQEELETEDYEPADNVQPEGEDDE